MKIKESYKMYWKLKTRALEETLTDISFSDDVENNIPTKTTMCTSPKEIKDENKSLKDNNKQIVENTNEKDKKDMENTNEKDVKNTSLQEIENIKKDTENIDPEKYQNQCQNQYNNVTIDEKECKNVKDVWGNHLQRNNEKMPKKKETLLIGRSSSFQLSQNKFTNSNFTKRNPRKSLSATKIKNKTEKDNDIISNTLEQNTNKELNNKDNSNIIEETKSIFGESMKITYMEPTSIIHSIGTVQQLIEGHTINRNLNPGWLNRCAKHNNLEYPAFDSQRFSGTSDSGIESTESSIYSPKENIILSLPQKSFEISDEEDFVCNSDSEEGHKNKRIRNFKKEFSDQENYSSKRMCLENCTNTSTLSKINVQTIHCIEDVNTIFNEEKFNVVLNKNNSINNNINIQTNLFNNIDKCNEKIKYIPKIETNIHDEENAEKSFKERLVNHKIQRKFKHISSDDSDVENDEKEKKNKKKISKTKRISTRKNKSTKESSTKEIKTRIRKRSSRKKEDIQDEDDFFETGNVNHETTKSRNHENRKSEIYGIETLEAVPRFAIYKNCQGDLIEQFAKSVSLKTNDLNSIKSIIKPRGQLTDKEKLEKKIAEGKTNENFVRINLKKKVFVRGKKHFNFSKYKKNQWKQRKKDLGSSENSLAVADFVEKNNVSTCFKCQSIGHFAKNCPNAKNDDLIPINEIDESSQFPTLEEAEQMASRNAIIAHANRIDRLPEIPSFSSKTQYESTVNEIKDETNDDDLWEPIEDEV